MNSVQIGEGTLDLCDRLSHIWYKVFKAVLLLLLLVQFLLHWETSQTFFNPVYTMEDNFLSGYPYKMNSMVLEISSDSLSEGYLQIIVNGIVIEEKDSDTAVILRLFKGDILEIDGRMLSHPCIIHLRSIGGLGFPGSWPEEMTIGAKLYRFQPLSLKNDL